MKLHKSLDPHLSSLPVAPRSQTTVAAIYFPGFHSTPVHNAWFGYGWSEWELVMKSRPRFEGHRQPILPQWGPFDESDPVWAAKEVDLAADHGIDAWIMDWYWYSGVEILNEALDKGFLNAPNRNRMKFGLMWANHTWANNFPAPQSGPSPQMLPIRHSLEDLDRVIDHCTKHYFSQPNYWMIGGKPWFSFFLLSSLLETLGGEVAAGRALERMRNRAINNGFKGLHLGIFTTNPAEAALAKKLGFDHSTTYNITESHRHRPGMPFDDYEDLMETHAIRWKEFAATGLPHWPVITQGWDVSSRNHPNEPWPPQRWNWPYGHIAVGNTPERFGQLCHGARRFLSTQPENQRVLVVNSWNEWTEGSVLLPTADQGIAPLQALKAALDAPS
ncbi:MAG: glycoside hydrolase family 99-like domain-containing protein [Chlorobium sp.]|nr:glycoside hydrolase family 99-like domain-containing protein [Chlorobium sp.]